MSQRQKISVQNSCEKSIVSPLSKIKWGPAPKGTLRVCVLGRKEKWPKGLKQQLSLWQWQELQENSSPIKELATNEGPLVLVCPYEKKGWDSPQQRGLLEESVYSITRDLVGEYWKRSKPKGAVQMEFVACGSDQRLGAMVGLAIAHYSFKNSLSKETLVTLYLDLNKNEKSKKEWQRAKAIGESINLARHLVNLPPQDLQPASYAQLVRKWFANTPNCKVEIWNHAKLKQEKMAMIEAVGRGAEHGPCMVRIKYRPRASSSPVAFVGKGITFDTGGLDLKPPANMRLMKKDMGGSAAVFALAHLANQIKSKQPADFYLAIAENAISAEAFHPSDVIQARNGLQIEIDNTDAEGRLVMGDVLTVAAEKKGKDSPQLIVNVATLTGAMKVALGNDIGGLFSNNDKLAERLEKLGQKWGDPLWRMPLFQPYRKDLNTPFGDMKNSGGRMGGSITAALFLESFVENKDWAHLDILGWQRGSGPYSEEGGSGQAVQGLMGLLL